MNVATKKEKDVEREAKVASLDMDFGKRWLVVILKIILD